MTDSITISAGNFTAEIYLGNFVMYQTLTKIRKLFKLIFSCPVENAEAIKQMKDTLNNIIAYTKANWRKASADYANNCHTIDAHGYGIPKKTQAKIDRPLITALKCTKAAYSRAIKIQKIFYKYKGEI